MYVVKENLLHFGNHPFADPDPGIFWRILQHHKIGHFSTIWLISLERVIGFLWKFCHSCICGQGSHLDPSRVRMLQIQSIFSLADVCSLWLLL